MEKESSLSVHKNSGKEGKKYDSSISLAFQDLLQCSLQKSCRKRVIFSPRNEEKIMRAWDALLRFLFYPFDSSKSRVYTTLNVCSLVPTAVLFVKRAQKRGEEKEDFCTKTTRQKKKKAAKVFFLSSKKSERGRNSCISASPICLRLLLSNIHPLDYSKWNTISPRASFTDYFHGAFLTKAKSKEAFACGTMDHHWLLPWLTVFLSTTLDVLASLLQSCFINRKCQIYIYLA